MQKDCLSFSIEEAPGASCGDVDCLWRVCLRFDTSLEGCIKTDSISYACDTGDDVTGCVRDESDHDGWDSTQIEPFLDGGTMCVYARKGEDVKFLLNDGESCGGSEYFFLGDGAEVSCRPSENPTCTDNAAGSECWWTVKTPEGDCSKTIEDVKVVEDVTSPPAAATRILSGTCLEGEDAILLEKDCGESGFAKSAITLESDFDGEVKWSISNWLNHNINWMQIVYRDAYGDLGTTGKVPLAVGEKTPVYTSQCVNGWAILDMYVSKKLVDENKEVCDGWDPESDVCQYKVKLSCNLCPPETSPPTSGPTPCISEPLEYLDVTIGDGPKTCEGNMLENNFNETELPVKVIGRSDDGDKITFKLNQDFYSGVVQKLAVHLRRNTTFTDCDVEENVPYNWETTYTAQCFLGVSHVNLYLLLKEA